MKYKVIVLFLLSSTWMFSQNVATYTYTVKSKDSLKLDVYTPQDVETHERLPVVVWMHGGGFAGGSRDGSQEQQLMRFLNNNGFIGVSISYRLLRQGARTGFGCQCTKQEKLFTFANAAEDLLDATKFLIDNSDSLQIDTSKIIAGGSSAGAEAVLSAVYMKGYFLEDVSAYEDISYAGVLSFAGALVDESYITKENAVPTILFHGTKDDTVPYAKAPHHFCKEDDKGYLILNGSEIIYKQLEQLNTSYYLFKVEGGKHEIASIMFHELDEIVNFINQTIINSKIIQTKRLETKE